MMLPSSDSQYTEGMFISSSVFCSLRPRFSPPVSRMMAQFCSFHALMSLPSAASWF